MPHLDTSSTSTETSDHISPVDYKGAVLVDLLLHRRQLHEGDYPKCFDNRRASATSVRTGFAAELNGITDISQT